MRKKLKRGMAHFLALTLAVSGMTVTGVQKQEVKADEPNYQLVWSDEFNGTALDKSAWNVEVNGDGGGNGELQYYREENIAVNNGTLKITARKENYQGKNYTSGRITTQDKKYFQYGRFEARMKLPSFKGAWPAFWTLGQTYGDLGWPACSEIDIMEAINDENKVYGTLHWLNGSWVAAEYGQSTNVADRTDWHVYAMEWDENEVRWYCDGVKYHTQAIDEADMDEVRGAQFILFNLAIGGSWPGYEVDDAAFTNGRATMEVDYVRVYQDVNNKAMTYQTATRDSNWHAYGNWEVNVASDRGSSKAQVGVDPLDGDHIKLQQLASSWDDANLVQTRYRKKGLVPGQKYKISVDLTSHSTDGSYVTDARDDGASISLLKGTRTVIKTMVADANGEVYITFGTGWVGTTVVLDFANVNCRVYDPNEVEEVSDVMEFISAKRDSTYHKYGNWQIFVEDSVGTSQAKVAVDETDADHIQVQHSQVDWGGVSNHAFVRAKYTAKNLTPGETYTLSVRMLTSSADGSYSLDNIDVEIPELEKFTSGERYVNKTAKADANGEISVEFGFGWVGVGVIINFDDISCVKGTNGVTAKTWNYQSAANGNSTCGNWNIYVGTDWSGQTAKVAADPANADYISVVPLSVNWGAASQWSVQAKYAKNRLTPGKQYKMTVEMTAMGGEGSYMVDNVPEDKRVGLAPQVGNSTVTKIAEADANGEVYITFGLGMLANNTVVNLKLLSCEEYNENQPTKPAEPTTEQPVTEAPTKEEATTAEPTTEVPTTTEETKQDTPQGTNLAKGKTVTASGNENEGAPAANAVDGNDGTRWSSNFADDAWITVDLGKTYAVNKVVLNWEAAFGESYKIQTSLDGKNWTTAKELSGQDGGIDTITFNAVNARYVRMQGVKRALPYGYSLWELEVYGGTAFDNTQSTTYGVLSKGKTVTASGVENDAMAAKNAVDGDKGTRWSSNFADDAWVIVDLGATYSVDKVVLNWEGAYGESYNIQVSTDGKNFTTVKSLTGQNGGEDTVTFGAVNARYVRMQGVKRALPYGYSLWEMEVYGR